MPYTGWESSYHNINDIAVIGLANATILKPATKQYPAQQYSYRFENFFHPFVGKLIAQLNQTSVSGMLKLEFLATCTYTYTSSDYQLNKGASGSPAVVVTMDNQSIDVQLPGGPYANYNWELLYHIPVVIAVHLSNSQRFAEAQKWFHLVFDPTNAQQKYWQSYVFNGANPAMDLTQLLQLLSAPDAQLMAKDPTGGLLRAKTNVITGYNAIMAKPFDPFVAARTRISSFQWYVVMKYLDNLIAWGDSLFLQDTIETLNEATLCYVLAANLLGPKPQAMPQPGTNSPKNFLQLKQAGLDRMSNAFVELEAQFPFNTAPPPGQPVGGSDQSGALFGISRSLYFCIPQNQTLMAYWDTVADRLFKIRNSENIQGMVQQLPLFDPPLDPGMLVQAAAAGIDIGGIISGLNQPIGPERSLLLIQKALEIATEVKSLGTSLLSSLEKGDTEHLANLRQGHEVQLQQMTQNVRYLQWMHAQETTNALLASRAGAYERYVFYLRLLGLTPDSSAPVTLPADRKELTQDNWIATYSALLAEYSVAVPLQNFGALQLAQGNSPSSQSGASGTGQLYLNTSEDAELNTHRPTARDTGLAASVINAAAAVLTVIPDIHIDLHYWGLGAHSKVFGGDLLATAVRVGAEVTQMVAAFERDQAEIAKLKGGYQRRTDEWLLQANLAAHDLMTIGRQTLASLIAEQVSRHDYDTVTTQVQQAKDVQGFLQAKFTNEALYGWMQSELSGLYYQYYRFACDTARRAEQTMKQELMRPELNQTQFIRYNYWDSGHQGLLSGEALHLDIKRLEMAYHDSNKRELEILRHVSLRQLDPVALLTLRITGSCSFTIPEWLYDRDCPGLYMRRIKTVAVSIPSVVGPYTGINCTLTLQSSTLRASSLLANGAYARSGADDDRFIDYFGSTDVIVTSGGNADNGMFETNLRDDRFLPFEGAGAISTWNIALPAVLRSFDYSTISDVILHVRYTARLAGDPLGAQATKELAAMLDTAGQSGQALVFCLRYDFPTEWSAFINGTGDFQVTLQRLVFPYIAQNAAKLTVDGLSIYAANGAKVAVASPVAAAALTALNAGLAAAAAAVLTLAPDPAVLLRQPEQLVFMVLQYHFGRA